MIPLSEVNCIIGRNTANSQRSIVRSFATPTYRHNNGLQKEAVRLQCSQT